MSLVRADQLEIDKAELGRIADRFGLRTLEPLGGYENLLFRSTDPTGVVMRITHTSRRNVEQIAAEFEFIEHLAKRGAPVIGPVHSTDGKLVVEWTTEKGEPVLIAAMTEAPGAFKTPADWTVDDFETYGRTLAQLHDAGEDFEPSCDAHRRPPWFHPQFDPGFGDDPLRPRFERIIERARNLPAGGSGLLIHQDAHHGNLFFTEEGQITVFDFDDCGYGTVTHDLAICLFYRFFGKEDVDLDTLRAFTQPFLRGYREVRALPEDWPRGVDEFLSLREVELLFLMQSISDLRPIHERFIERGMKNVREDLPYLGWAAEEWAGEG